MVLTTLADNPSGDIVEESSSAAAASINRNVDIQSAQSGRPKVALEECPCCNEEVDFEDMVSCRTEGHLLCKVCLRNIAEVSIFDNRNFGVLASHDVARPPRATELICFNEKCNSGYHEKQIQGILSEQAMQKYNELQFMTSVEMAQMDDASKCPKCQYVGFAKKSMNTLVCPVCYYTYCRNCGEEAHGDVLCDRVKTKPQKDGRKIVEEAMSDALIRTCPKCGARFVKTYGCNRMVCRCGAVVCYMCREVILTSGHQHWCCDWYCLHVSCNKCPLQRDHEEEAEKKAVELAGASAARLVLRETLGGRWEPPHPSQRGPAKSTSRRRPSQFPPRWG